MSSGITGTFAKGPKPAAIPEFRVRYPRITHPFATKFFQVLPPEKTPFDLHALATPPAFVLSQDQTLQFLSLQRPGVNPTVRFDGINV